MRGDDDQALPRGLPPGNSQNLSDALYDRVIEGHFGPSALYRRLIEHFHRFLEDEGAFEDLAFTGVPGHAFLFEVSRWTL